MIRYLHNSSQEYRSSGPDVRTLDNILVWQNHEAKSLSLLEGPSLGRCSGDERSEYPNRLTIPPHQPLDAFLIAKSRQKLPCPCKKDQMQPCNALLGSSPVCSPLLCLGASFLPARMLPLSPVQDNAHAHDEMNHQGRVIRSPSQRVGTSWIPQTQCVWQNLSPVPRRETPIVVLFHHGPR
jgi:hypothetical protein